MHNQYTAWLRRALIVGLFASLFIPFIIANGTLVPNMFFPFITGKNFVFRILVEVLLGLYVLLALREPKYRPRSSTLLWTTGVFVAWVGVSMLFSVDPVKSFWSNFERMEGYIGLLHLFAYFVVASAVLSAQQLWTRFLQTSVGVSVVMSGYGFLQLFGHIAIDQGSTRLDGTLGNAAYFAVYELFNIFFALFLLAKQWNVRTARILYGIAITLDTFILFYTETRGTVLGLIAGLLVACVYIVLAGRHAHELKKLRTVAMGGLVAVVAVIALFFAVRSVPAVQHAPAFGRLATISLSDKTTMSRFMIWHMAWDGFKEKPLFGWGQENFSYVFNKYYNPAMYDQEQWFDRAHNAFIDQLIASGLPGFLLFLSIFGAAAFTTIRARSLSLPERAALLGLLVGYGVHEMFVFDNLVSSIQFFTVLALLHGLSQREVPKRAWMTRPLSQEGISVAAPILIVATVVAVYYLNMGGIANATGLVRAITPPSSTSGAVDLTSNLAQFKTVLAGAPLGRQEATEQLAQFTMQLAPVSSVSPDVKQQFAAATYDALTNMTNARKGDARLELFFGAYLDGIGRYQDALVHLSLAHQESPKKQQMYFETAMNNLIPSGDAKSAAAVLGAAYDLDHSYDTARVYYAAALYLAGANAQADALLVERFGTVTPDSDALLQVLLSTKQYARAQVILSARLAKDPNDSQQWLRYAGTYYLMGDKQGAISVLQRAAQADPAFASQANSIISQLKTGK